MSGGLRKLRGLQWPAALTVPNLPAVMAIGCLALLVITLTQPPAFQQMPLVWARVLEGEVWRVFTFAVMPLSGSIIFGLFQAYFFFWAGQMLRGLMGDRDFNALVFLTGGAALALAGLTPNTPAIASLAIDAVMIFSLAYLVPDHKIMLFAIIPVAIKWLAILPGFFLIGGVLNALSAGAWASAVQIAVPALVFLWFFGSDITRRLKGKRRQMQRRDERLRELETPRHVCAVCGRDNLSDPTLEFRYLETPGGTQCRCIDDLDAA